MHKFNQATHTGCKKKGRVTMDEKNSKQETPSNISNYDWVWGSDQDQYLTEEASKEVKTGEEIQSTPEQNSME